MNGLHRRIFSNSLIRSSILPLIHAPRTKTINARNITPLRMMVFGNRGGGYRVFCNPPYGRQIAEWVRKAYETNLEHGNLVVMLIPARTDTKWFHDYIYGKAEIRFVKGRLKFNDCRQSAPFPSMIVIYRGGRDKNGKRR